MYALLRMRVDAMWLCLDRCAACAPDALDGLTSKIFWADDYRPRSEIGFVSAFSGEILDRDDAFVSKRGGAPLLMDEDAPLPWSDGSEDRRPRMHILSLLDAPEVGFDPTGFPLVVFQDEARVWNLTWVADGR